MSSSKSLFEDVKWALSNRKLGPFKTPLKKPKKMHKYAEIGSSLKQGKTEEKIAFTSCRKHHINKLS
ncbi:MAG: hypothetical protein EGR08_02025 [Prevotella sp.]|nr:hypothetical protein [Prevotella sp.]